MKDIPLQPNLLSLLGQQDQTFVEIEACLTCGSKQAIQVPGKGQHHLALRCANCDPFIKWLAKPKLEGGAS